MLVSLLNPWGLAGAFALVCGPMWFVHGFANFRRKRLIENTPTAKIRSMAMGLVEVNGTVESRSAVRAPFSGRPCVFWHVEIATPDSRNGWHTVHRNDSGQPFFLQDGTAVALVYPRGAECSVSFQVEEECQGISLPSVYDEYLKQNAGGGGLWRLGTLRFRERILEETQRVFVLGTAMPRSHALSISDGDEMAATGTDGDRHAIRLQTLTEATVAVIRQGETEKTFLISQESERMVTLGLGAKALVGMIGGPLASLYGLAWLLDLLKHAPRAH
jgi:hypothetical protein